MTLIGRPDRAGLRGTLEIQRLGRLALAALRLELSRTHRSPVKGDVSVADSLVVKLPDLRYMTRFRRSAPLVLFAFLFFVGFARPGRTKRVVPGVPPPDWLSRDNDVVGGQ